MSSRKFRPIAYRLSDKGLEFPLKQNKTSAKESREGQIISVWELLKELEGNSYRVEDQLTCLIVETEFETRILEANSCVLDLTNVILSAWHQGVKPLHLAWFWLETVGDSHTFFVVDTEKDQIFLEEMRLVEGPETSSRFDRALFEPDRASRFSGVARYWYNRFYQETRLGKHLMLAPMWVRLLTRQKIFYYSGDWRSDLRAIRFLLVAILVCLIVLLVRR